MIASIRAGEAMGFKANLKRLREAKGWTQTKAADAAGVAFRSYQNWETGSREPRLDALKKLAEAFGVRTDDLLASDNEEPEPAKPVRKGRK